MLVVVSPAKRLNWTDQGAIAPELPVTTPLFQSDAQKLARIARALSAADLQRLMGISEDLATLNQARFQSFSGKPDQNDLRRALFAFAGDTYVGLEPWTIDPETLTYAQSRLRILSGLYGLLRPFDGIQPYRLEMGTRLVTPKGSDLYDYWGHRIARALNDLAEVENARILINCASVEYFNAAGTSGLKLRTITPVFLESRNGATRIVSFFAKKARGAMARYVLENRMSDPRHLCDFTWQGYRYSAELSEGDRYVFERTQP